MTEIILSLVSEFLPEAASIIIIIRAIIAAWKWKKENTWKRFSFSCGVVWMKQKDVNVSNLTNAISFAYFSGGRISNEVRAEIIAETCAEFQAKKQPLIDLPDWLKKEENQYQELILQELEEEPQPIELYEPLIAEYCNS